MSLTLDTEMARLERLLADRHARNADTAAKFPVRRMAPHAAGTPFSTLAKPGGDLVPLKYRTGCGQHHFRVDAMTRRDWLDLAKACAFADVIVLVAGFLLTRFA